MVRNITPGYLAESLEDFRRVFKLQIPNEEAIVNSQRLIEQLVDETPLKEDTADVAKLVNDLVEFRTKIVIDATRQESSAPFSVYGQSLDKLSIHSGEMTVEERF